MAKRPRILLIYAPFGLVESPNLGVSLVKASAVDAGYECDVLYASIEFAQRLGFKDYLSYSHSDSQVLLPERIFARALSDAIPPMLDYYEKVVMPFNDAPGTFLAPAANHGAVVERLESIESIAIEYCDELAARPELDRYDIFGFSSSTGQNAASLAIARRIKARFPERLVVFGGANADGPMGPQLALSFPFLDYTFAAEGDVTFPLFLDALRDGRPVDIPGVFSRGNAAHALAAGYEPLLREDMDAAPIPDFSDWFDAFARVPGSAGYQMSIPVEGSRGCWWGQKHHCTFCGLNGTTMAYRAKTPERFHAEVEQLVERYGIRSVMATDNILDSRWPARLAELFAEHKHEVLFFEIKANIGKDDLAMLARAGVTHMNPGIESFDDHVLSLMNKGSRALTNVQILKWAEELGVTLQYCFISGFPDEKPDDYDRIAALLPKIFHLKPGKTFTRISIDRFSPYFSEPERYGLTLGLCPAYRYVFDLPDADLANLAYWYYSDSNNGSSRDTLAPPPYARRVAQLFRIWQRLYGNVHFWFTRLPDGTVQLEDTRPLARAAESRLDPLESALFLLADRQTHRAALGKGLREQACWSDTSDADIDAALVRLEDACAVHRDGDRYLALAAEKTGIPKGPLLAEAMMSPLRE